MGSLIKWFVFLLGLVGLGSTSSKKNVRSTTKSGRLRASAVKVIKPKDS